MNSMQLTTRVTNSVLESEVPRTRSVGLCPLCGSEQAGVLFRGLDRLHGTPGEFTYRRCGSCATVFQDPRVIEDDLHLCYPAEYLTHVPVHTPGSDSALRGRPLRSLRDRLRRSIVDAVRGQQTPGLYGIVGRWLAASRYLREKAFHDYVPDALLPFNSENGRALEIGCGSGKLLLGLSRVGWRAEGVEVDPVAAQLAREVSGQRVWDGDFRRASLEAGSYDLIVLNHVLEHLEDPISALQRGRELLAPGGRVVLLYPNPSSLGARIYRADWLAWDVPRHLVLPAGKQLWRHAYRAGLLPVKLQSSASGAEGVLALSRARSEGKRVVVGHYRLTPAVRVLATLERVLVRLGFFVGEEITMELRGAEDEERDGRTR